MDCSFDTEGRWFVFDTYTGRTLKRGFLTKAKAVTYIARELWGAKQ